MPDPSGVAVVVAIVLGMLVGLLVGYRWGKHAGILQGYDDVQRSLRKWK